MINKPSRKLIREKRHYRLRANINGTASKPRLSVYRSNMHIYAQIIDDTVGNTIVSASTLDKELSGSLDRSNTVEAASKVGELVAKRAKDKGIDTVIFDRGGYVYHGKVKALAEAAREAGLQF